LVGIGSRAGCRSALRGFHSAFFPSARFVQIELELDQLTRVVVNVGRTAPVAIETGRTAFRINKT